MKRSSSNNRRYTAEFRRYPSQKLTDHYFELPDTDGTQNELMERYLPDDVRTFFAYRKALILGKENNTRHDNGRQPPNRQRRMPGSKTGDSEQSGGPRLSLFNNGPIEPDGNGRSRSEKKVVCKQVSDYRDVRDAKNHNGGRYRSASPKKPESGDETDDERYTRSNYRNHKRQSPDDNVYSRR